MKRYFRTLVAANASASRIFDATKVVVAIEQHRCDRWQKNGVAFVVYVPDSLEGSSLAPAEKYIDR